MCLVRWVLALALAAGLFGIAPAGADASSTATVYYYDVPASVTTAAAIPRTGRFRTYDDQRNVLRPRMRANAARLATKAADDAVRLPARQSFGNPAKLDDHFRRHGGDFGAKSADDYAAQASDFLQNSQRQRLPTKIDADGVVRVYDPRSNTFGAYNPGGTSRTFFKPSSPGYFDRQPGSAPRP